MAVLQVMCVNLFLWLRSQQCIVSDAETELRLWSKTFAEGNMASVLISTTTVLCNMNLSPLSMITPERHPPLHWLLWDNAAHTSKWTCAHTDSQMQICINLLISAIGLLYTKHTLSLSFIGFHCPLLAGQLLTVFDLFFFSYCYWFAHVVSMSMRTRDSGSDLAFFTSSTQTVPFAPHKHNHNGRQARETKVYTGLYENRVLRGVFFKPHFTLINSPKFKTAF